MLKLTLNRKTVAILLFLIILLIPAIYSLMLPGFFQSDDGEWMIIRFSAFYQALADGQFPVRFLGRLNFGYGYPVANFLYPGFMYLATPLQILGFGFVNSIKIVLLISMVGGGIFTFAWLLKIFDKTSALVGAIFYTYTPYHLFDLYKRGSVGEILSLGILPFILWQIERKSIFWIAIGIFLLILAHNTLAILFLLFIFCYVILSVYVSKDRRDTAFHYSKAIFLGIGMASFFWIPAFYDLKYTVFSDTKVSDWSNYFADINLVGLSTIAVFLLVFALIILKKIDIKKHRLTVLFLAIGLFSVFLATSLSSVLWNFLPASFIQFPFRLLSLLLPIIAFLVGSVLWVINGRNKVILAGVLIVLVFVSSRSFLTPSVKSDKGDSFYSTNEATTTVKDEYMPVWVKEKPITRFKEKIELESGGKINNLVYNSKRIDFETSQQSETKARINTIYYPGWNAKINDRRAEILFTNEKGVMEVKLPKGENRVELVFAETRQRMASDALSVLAFVALIFWNRESLLNNRLIRRIK